jgi:HAD superfamily hydrolase (TIGR01509 family)
VEYYDKLQNTVGGGKPKMFYHFRNTVQAFPTWVDVDNGSQQPAPSTLAEQQRLIDILQDYKTAHFVTLLETEAVPRPGVVELMDEALADPTIAVGVCSAATKAAALQTLDICLGPDRIAQLDVLILGDDVSAKKPDPLIYNTARSRLNDLAASKCVVVEDSLVGLRAAVAAQMKCVITYTNSTADQNFYAEGAIATLPDLASRGVTLRDIFGPLRTDGDGADILVGQKDAVKTVP